MIWKKPEEKPKSFSFILEHHKAYDFDNHKVITAYDVFETGGNPQNPFDENTIRWCYLDELLAQADKAERLQAKLRTIAYMEQRLCIDDPVDILDDVLKIAKDEIKQTTKEN